MKMKTRGGEKDHYILINKLKQAFAGYMFARKSVSHIMSARSVLFTAWQGRASCMQQAHNWN